MSESAVYRLTTAVLFTAAAALGAWAGHPLAVYVTYGCWLAWLTMTDATREQVATLRRRTVVALARLRRRHDAELLEVWCVAHEKPAAEYGEPFDPDPATDEQSGYQLYRGLTVEGKPGDDTDEIPVAPATVPIALPDPNPATVPDLKAASKVGPLPTLTDEAWQAQQEAFYEAAMAKIRGT